METFCVFKRTTDDWYPAYVIKNDQRVNKLVEVSLLKFALDKGYRVCVWGADDYGLEKDYPIEDQEEAKTIFLKVIGLEDVTQNILKDMGFYPA